MFQSFGIGYQTLNPDGLVRVHADEPKPILRVKPDAKSGFRRYGFVDAVLALDPVGKLGLTAADFKVIEYFSSTMLNFIRLGVIVYSYSFRL